MSRCGGILKTISEYLGRALPSSGILSEGDKRDINGHPLPDAFSKHAEMLRRAAIWLRSQHLGLGLGESSLPFCQHSLRSPRSECQQEGKTKRFDWELEVNQRATAGRASGGQLRFTSRCFQLLSTVIPGWKGGGLYCQRVLELARGLTTGDIGCGIWSMG